MPKSGPQLPEGEVAGLRERIERRLPTEAYLSYLSMKEKGTLGYLGSHLRAPGFETLFCCRVEPWVSLPTVCWSSSLGCLVANLAVDKQIIIQCQVNI